MIAFHGARRDVEPLRVLARSNPTLVLTSFIGQDFHVSGRLRRRPRHDALPALAPRLRHVRSPFPSHDRRRIEPAQILDVDDGSTRPGCDSKYPFGASNSSSHDSRCNPRRRAPRPPSSRHRRAWPRSSSRSSAADVAARSLVTVGGVRSRRSPRRRRRSDELTITGHATGPTTDTRIAPRVPTRQRRLRPSSTPLSIRSHHRLRLARHQPRVTVQLHRDPPCD